MVGSIFCVCVLIAVGRVLLVFCLAPAKSETRIHALTRKKTRKSHQERTVSEQYYRLALRSQEPGVAKKCACAPAIALILRRLHQVSLAVLGDTRQAGPSGKTKTAYRSCPHLASELGVKTNRHVSTFRHRDLRRKTIRPRPQKMPEGGRFDLGRTTV